MKDLLRIATSGSVDDGKSTLIGRLLFDTRSITNDKLEAIEATSKRKGLDFIDLSLLTDGLIAEREQGITIDVAHIYFSTPTRKYIIADSPGHVEYTRNMITGASTAGVSIVLVDARKGVVEQTRRHFFIASLLRIKQVMVCVNKMDLVGYAQEVFRKIVADFTEVVEVAGFEGQQVEFIPIAAREGDNVVYPSMNMEWYTGSTLLEYLENCRVLDENQNLPARFPVQYVIRPQQDAFHDFRGYAGRVASGYFSKGDEVLVLPSGQTSPIKSISKTDIEQEKALVTESVVITLEHDIDISRGNMIVRKDEAPALLKSIKATICWMDASPAVAGKAYWLQHGINRVKAKLSRVSHTLDIHSLQYSETAAMPGLNDISIADLNLAHPIFADGYTDNPANGSFILIDEFSNNTIAVGFINNV